ncbi:MAG: trypsin-like peptidase domain-containing protein [Gammaproteobacteria bacterium]|nr:trypsin-like peptidase domain-containing protein [Gammaproteobacteria bacterium]
MVERLLGHFALLMGMALVGLTAHAQDARELFSQYRDDIYQIRVIELSSGAQSALGSGFIVSDDGIIVTNFHVVSDFVHHPLSYRLQVVAFDKSQHDAVLLDVDVIHDLAVLRVAGRPLEHLTLAPELPEQGDAIYSIGNPHDLGWTVIPGIYNGLAAHSFYERIHFSGSVNPGMSGGPVLNSTGQVVGVNVATAGNQVSFLVPLQHLRGFLDQAARQPLDLAVAQDHIREQLFLNQQHLVGDLIAIPWPQTEFGQALVPGEIAPYIRCWGRTNQNPDIRYNHFISECSLDDNIFLSGGFQTGAIVLHFGWFESEELNSFQFYNLLKRRMSRVRPDNNADEEDVTNFACHDDLVQSQSREGREIVTKSTFCSRQYKRYPGLYDVIYLGGTLQDDKQALLSHFTLSGVSQELATAFLKKFMENVQWN